MSKKLNFNVKSSRTFGVEVEFFGVTAQQVIDALHFKNIRCVYEGYNHTTREHWKLVTDASVNGAGTMLGRGLEIVSPVLKGSEGLAELAAVLRTLTEIGAKVDTTCGVHVHIGVNDLQFDGLKNIIKWFVKHEEELDKVMPPSRRNGQYCAAFSRVAISEGWVIRSLSRKELMERIDRAGNMAEVTALFGTRYLKVNTQSYVRQGTIEFRQHGGSTDAVKVTTWVRYLLAIVEWFKDHKVSSRELSGSEEQRFFRTFNGTGTIQYWRERYAHFQGRTIHA